MILLLFVLVYLPEIDLTFIVNAASSRASVVFNHMQRVMESIVNRYSQGRIFYSVIVVNGTSPYTVYKFGTVFPDKIVLVNALSKIQGNTVGGSSLDKALQLAANNYNSSNVRSFAIKFVVIITDKRTGLTEAVLRDSFIVLQNAGVRVIPVGIGTEVNDLELKYITAYGDQILMTSSNMSFVSNGEEIMNRIVRSKFSYNPSAHSLIRHLIHSKQVKVAV